MNSGQLGMAGQKQAKYLRLRVEGSTASLEVASEIYAGPAVRKLARELGVQLQRVDGTGPQGRIVKEDLQQFVRKSIQEPSATVTGAAAIPLVPDIDFAKFGEVQIIPRSKVDKLTAANMHRSWLNVPHVTQFDEADITDLEEFRAGLKAEAEQRSTRITPLPFSAEGSVRLHCEITRRLTVHWRAVVKTWCIRNIFTCWRGRRYTPAGLMVPVIRDVNGRKTSVGAGLLRLQIWRAGLANA